MLLCYTSTCFLKKKLIPKISTLPNTPSIANQLIQSQYRIIGLFPYLNKNTVQIQLLKNILENNPVHTTVFT